MIIIPDIHGRSFWKEAINGRETEKIIFLGDYVDPYTQLEHIDKEEGMNTLQEVIALKKRHPEDVVLLLGNHDLGYALEDMGMGRHDYENHDIIQALLEENMELFDIAFEDVVDDRCYLFTHAGIVPAWLKEHQSTLDNTGEKRLTDQLNHAFHSNLLNEMLNEVSHYRGGYDSASSPVWADVHEHLDDPDPIYGYYQIFGHTLQISGKPIIHKNFACLDCRCAFWLDGMGNLHKIENNR